MMTRRLIVLVCTMVFAALNCRAAGTDAPAAQTDAVDLLKRTGKAFTEVSKKAIPAVVFITGERIISRGGGSYRPHGGDYYDLFDYLLRGRGYDSMPPRSIQQGGSGFIISKDGYILTNNHVVKDADKITVRLHDGREMAAKKTGSDPRSEVAVIKIDANDLPFLELGDSAALEIGEWVIAVGNPFGFFTESVTVGVVSAKGRSNLDLAQYEDFIQTDAAINPGNSGGPLLNIEGKVVGINTAIYSQSGGYMGIGLAIPINMAKVIKDQLIKTGKIIRGYLGVRFNPTELDAEMAKTLGMKKAEGALIAEVLEASPAAEAGIKPGDVIVGIDGKRVPNMRSLMSSVALMAPDAKTKISVFRDGGEKVLDLKIGAYPEDIAQAVPGQQEAGMQIGLTVTGLTKQVARRFNYNVDQGVVVSDVEPGSIADQAGIEPGNLILSINRQVVNNVKDYSQLLEQSLKAGRVLMRVRNEQYSWFVLLRAD